MTLAEVLIAVAILALFVSMALVGTSGLFGTAEEMSVVSKAAVLGSDVMQIITNEIRYGDEFSTDDKNKEILCFTSSSYGSGCKMYELNGELVLTKNEDSTPDPFLPIGEVAYDEVSIESLTFSVNGNSTTEGSNTEDSKKTTVEVTLTISGNGQELWKHTVTIVPLSHKLI